MTPPNEHTSEGGRDDRGVPYHAEPTLSSAQVLKMLAADSDGDPAGDPMAKQSQKMTMLCQIIGRLK